jgi:hypothetical protein
MPPTPLELLVSARLVGASPASPSSLRRRSLWIHISWMKLSIIDGNKKKTVNIVYIHESPSHELSAH